MAWTPGKSGNPAGAPPKSKRFITMLERAIEQDDAKRLRAAADALLDNAAKGESWAIQMLADRLDGKPQQTIEQNSKITYGAYLIPVEQRDSDPLAVSTRPAERSHTQGVH